VLVGGNLGANPYRTRGTSLDPVYEAVHK